MHSDRLILHGSRYDVVGRELRSFGYPYSLKDVEGVWMYSEFPDSHDSYDVMMPHQHVQHVLAQQESMDFNNQGIPSGLQTDCYTTWPCRIDSQFDTRRFSSSLCWFTRGYQQICLADCDFSTPTDIYTGWVPPDIRWFINHYNSQ